MATYRAIEAACTALARALADAPRPVDLAGDRWDFRLVDAGEVTRGVRHGAGILPYRVRQVSGSLPPRGPGEPVPPSLAVEVQLLVVVVADDPAARLALTGWVLRTIHDHPVVADGVRVTADDVPRPELLQMWHVLGLSDRDALALPFVLTGLVLDSTVGDPPREP